MDWRITNQAKYLMHQKVTKKTFFSVSNWDHEHCVFCWKKIGETENTIHEAYCTLDEKHWICTKCFNDFCKEFELTVIETE